MADACPITVGEVYIEHTKRFDVRHTATATMRDAKRGWLVHFDTDGPFPIWHHVDGILCRMEKEKPVP
ncbi:MAG TPA: hypothetical protein VGK74_02565 [Symbiobacteriaceae bacterium]|jgi:hypothetical protein